MGLRRLIVEADVSTLNVAGFCAEHGISRWFFYDLRRRHARDGEVVLEPGSRAPRRVRNRTSTDVEDVVVRLRKELLDAGLDAGPATIWDHLPSLVAGPVPSEATVWRILHRRGLVVPDRRRPRSVRGDGSWPSGPTSDGRSTRRTGPWPMAPAWRSST